MRLGVCSVETMKRELIFPFFAGLIWTRERGAKKAEEHRVAYSPPAASSTQLAISRSSARSSLFARSFSIPLSLVVWSGPHGDALVPLRHCHGSTTAGAKGVELLCETTH